MNRLRSRLIAAFLGVAVLAMVPLVVISYYTYQIRNQKVRLQWLENTQREVIDFINYQSNIPTEVLLPLAQYLQDLFSTSANLLDLLEMSESLDDPVVRDQLGRWEERLWDKVRKKDVPGANLLVLLAPQLLKQSTDASRKYPQFPIQIIPKKPYLRMKEWLDKGDEVLFYQEEGRIYCYNVQPILKGERKSEMEEVGALFCKILFIEKYDDPTQFPDVYLRLKRYDPQLVVLNALPNIFERYLSKDELARLFGFSPYSGYREINLDWARIDANDYSWPQRFRLNPSPVKIESDIPSNDTSTVPMQMKLIPIVNHRRELTAVMVLGAPIVSIIETIGYSLLVGYTVSLAVIVFAAVWFARTIARPIHELAGAARQMADGDFDARVQEKGTEEQRILSVTFNQLAERIQNQLVQLRQQTHDLETSNRELSQTQHFLQNILANIRTGVMSVDREGRISHINSVGESILHVSEWRQKDVAEAISCASFTNLIVYALRQAVSVHQNEVPYERRDGALVPLQVSIAPVIESGELSGLVVTYHDLSTIRQLEEQVRRQDRLASLGRMAAGVAHEIRNPLGIIRGSAELLRNRFSGQPGEEGLSEFILEEVRRLSRVVNDFLLFARPPEPNREEIPIDFFFEEMADYFTKQRMGAAYTLKTECVGAVPPIAADLNLCRQVFLNLFLNAQDAMPNGGEIVLRAQVFSQREVAIDVQDSGDGIPPDRIDKIFDPFYTSKDTGTGLGLSLVHQIMSNHGGRIEVESTPGKGSLFRLIFLNYASLSDAGAPDGFSPDLLRTVAAQKTVSG